MIGSWTSVGAGYGACAAVLCGLRMGVWGGNGEKVIAMNDALDLIKSALVGESKSVRPERKEGKKEGVVCGNG